MIGHLANSGIKLRTFPASLTTWGEWLAEHPDTTVLSTETGIYPRRPIDEIFYLREDDVRSAYFDYRASPDTMFPIWERDDRLETKD